MPSNDSQSTPVEEINPFDVRVLDPSTLRVFRSSPDDAKTRLTLEGDRSWHTARIARAFPFSDPDHYIGLRDGDDKDIGILPSLEGVEAESLRVINEELARRYFTPRVEKVRSVDEQHGTITWEVDTDRGPRRFVVRNVRDNSYPLGPKRLMMLDTEGNRYEFPDVTSYGAKALAVLSKVI